MTKNLGRSIFKIEMQKGGPANSAILQNWFPSQEIRFPSWIWGNLQNMRKVLLNHVEYNQI